MKSMIRGTLVLALAVASIGFAGAGDLKIKPNPFVCPQVGSEFMEFTIAEPFQLESVQCVNYFSHVDLHQYGTITGDNCVITDPNISQHDGTNGGNIDVTFQMIDGTSFTAHRCRVDSQVDMPNDHTVAIDCL